MIKHIFKLMWNRKRKNALLIIEIFAAFIVLFALSSYILYNYTNYIQPLGYEYDRVWAIEMDWPRTESDFVYEKQQQMKQIVLNFEEVEIAALSAWATPFNGGGSRTSVEVDGQRLLIDILSVDEDYPELFQIDITEGRSLQAVDTINNTEAAMINQLLADKLLAGKNNLGKQESFFGVDRNGKDRGGVTVKGVFTDFKKYGEFTAPRGAMIYLHENDNYKYNTLFVRIKAGAISAELEERLLKTVSRIGKNWNIEITRLSDSREENFSESMIPIYIFSLIAGFLIINVALGLFGVLWFNIQQRKSEIGLRRVIGALAVQIQSQIVSETVVMSIIGLLIGLFFAIQVPILKLFNVDSSIFAYGMLISALFISLIAAICSAYPSYLASKILPAITLHED